MADLELSRDGFIAWLRSLPPNEDAGKSQSSQSCPLSRWLHDLGMGSAWVGFEHWGVFVGADLQKLPAWARAFVADVDQTYPTREPVPAAAYLRILGEPTAEDLAVAEAEALTERAAVPA